MIVYLILSTSKIISGQSHIAQQTLRMFSLAGTAISLSMPRVSPVSTLSSEVSFPIRRTRMWIKLSKIFTLGWKRLPLRKKGSISWIWTSTQDSGRRSVRRSNLIFLQKILRLSNLTSILAPRGHKFWPKGCSAWPSNWSGKHLTNFFWPIFLVWSSPWYCIISPLLETNTMQRSSQNCQAVLSSVEIFAEEKIYVATLYNSAFENHKETKWFWLNNKAFWLKGF